MHREGVCDRQGWEWGVLRGSVNRQEEFGWVRLTLTLLLDLNGEQVFIFSSWISGVDCSQTAVEPCGFPFILFILKTHSGLLQRP